mgnify:FL=1
MVLAYGTTRIVGLLATGAPLVDFVQAYKWVFYLLAFTMAIGQKLAWPRTLASATWMILAIWLAKYSYDALVLHSPRPYLVAENNYELALISGLVIVTYEHLGRRRLTAILLLGALVGLSGSRSAAVAFLVVAAFALTRPGPRAALRSTIAALCVPMLAYGVYEVFRDRAEANGVDRLTFLNFFLAEVHNWNIVDWLFGSPPITPLNFSTCSALSFYADLLSSRGDGSCYAVILHVFVLRVTFDAGLLGLALAFGLAYYAMTLGGVSLGIRLALIGTAVANSLSVSGLNNAFVALPILLAILSAAAEVRTRIGFPSDQTLRPRMTRAALSRRRTIALKVSPATTAAPRT